MTACVQVELAKGMLGKEALRKATLEEARVACTALTALLKASSFSDSGLPVRPPPPVRSASGSHASFWAWGSICQFKAKSRVSHCMCMPCRSRCCSRAACVTAFLSAAAPSTHLDHSARRDMDMLCCSCSSWHDIRCW
jgi:hypothetical protein